MDEKANEKQQEKGFEKWRRDPLSAVIWAGILIWAGVALLAYNLRLLAGIPIVSSLAVWELIFAGAGLLLLLEVLLRLLFPSLRGPVIGTLILGMVFMGIAFGSFIGWQIIVALLLVGIGIAVLIGGLRRGS